MKSNCCNANIMEDTDLCYNCKEHCRIILKPTNTNLGKFYNLDRRTIASYKKNNKNLYLAMFNYFTLKA